jgi:hypothetical protein
MWFIIALITTLSLAVAVLAVITAQRMRLERRRSDARVAALAAAIDDPHREATVDDPRWEATFDDEQTTHEAVSPAASVVSLVVPEAERPSRVPAFALAGLVVVGSSALLIAGMSGGGRTSRDAFSMASSIELVSMRHVLDGETLVVSGFVRNPTASATPSLSAVVSVFGRNGQVVARGASPLDPVVLGPGKETSFRVLVPDVGDPGRYRLAFMNGSQIVPHVDRRSELARTALVSDTRGN